MTGFTVWFTGLSGSGKTTIAKLVGKRLRELGLRVEHLDGDQVRKQLCKDLGYTKEDRDKNIERIAYVASLLTRNGVATLVSVISPYREARRLARTMIGRFVEVYTRCPLEVCAKRDSKGLYRKAFNGEIHNFTGVSDPYEEPENAELVIDTDQVFPEEAAEMVLQKLVELGYLGGANS
ncbi:MAG: adenylyl-sulfate kinase [Methanobacteriota archaeon]|nr:MAG: adenylyl-sulfate kinase [Euryarchaeota archaeon]